MRIVDLSPELSHRAFLPVSRRKIIIAGVIIAALSLLLMALDPMSPFNTQSPNPTLLILVTAIILILLALSTGKTPLRSVSALPIDRGEQLRVRLEFKRPISGVLEVGELIATEYQLGESIRTSFDLNPSSKSELHSISDLHVTLPSGRVAGLLVGSGENAKGILKCPALKISLINGPELYVVWVKSTSGPLKIGLEKSYLYLDGAQCSLSYGSKGSINYLLSAAERAGKLFSGKVKLKLLRSLNDGVLNLRHEEVIADVRNGEVDWGAWSPRTYSGEDVLIVLNGSRRLGDLLNALNLRDFVADPAPGVEYSFVLESGGWGLYSERDVAYITINSSGKEEEKEERA
ncbi:hypothetical protein HRbin02_00633 [Candidatus Calditenuaceae archaeon HR02]|nr:hypothetical protein HRbin02_00633 [Candidatus Calditenuaceae archaeon HR02]